jgi:hypothetical protein
MSRRVFVRKMGYGLTQEAAALVDAIGLPRSQLPVWTRAATRPWKREGESSSGSSSTSGMSSSMAMASTSRHLRLVEIAGDAERFPSAAGG